MRSPPPACRPVRWPWPSRSPCCRPWPPSLTRATPGAAVTVCNRSCCSRSARCWPAPAPTRRSRSVSRCAEQEVAVCEPTPHATTFGRVLAAVDPVALQYALTGWVLTRRAGHSRQHADGLQPRSEDRTVLAVDGKTLRGARDKHGEQTKLVAV